MKKEDNKVRNRCKGYWQPLPGKKAIMRGYGGICLLCRRGECEKMKDNIAEGQMSLWEREGKNNK